MSSPSRQDSMTLRITQATFLALVLAFFAAVAQAHPIPDIPVRGIFAGDGTLRITVEVEPRCLEIDPNTTPAMVPATLAALSSDQRAALCGSAAGLARRWVEFYLDPTGRVQPEFVFSFTGKNGAPLVGAEDVVVLTGEWRTPLGPGLTGWHIRATEAAELSVVFQNIVGGEVLDRLAVLFPGEKSFTLDLAELHSAAGDGWHTFASYLREGFFHVAPEDIHTVPRGLDHILFVLGVFLLSRKWKPLLAQVTTFTLAHSVTLALATLGIIHVSSRIVEPIIAASIAAVALENIFHPRYTRWRLLVVFAFGLIHGLGFASALGDLGLPRGSMASGLVGFNVGVECAQLAIITAAFLAVAWLRDPVRYRRWVVIPGSLAIAAVSVWWTISRIAVALK